MNVCTETSHRMNILEFTHISKALSDFFAAPISLTVVFFFKLVRGFILVQESSQGFAGGKSIDRAKEQNTTIIRHRFNKV